MKLNSFARTIGVLVISLLLVVTGTANYAVADGTTEAEPSASTETTESHPVEEPAENEEPLEADTSTSEEATTDDATETPEAKPESKPEPKPEPEAEKPSPVPSRNEAPATRDNTPADDDPVPAGILRDCIMGKNAKDVTFADSKQKTSATFNSWCTSNYGPETSFNNWTGYEFFPNLTKLQFTYLGKIENLPASIGSMFGNLESLTISTLRSGEVPELTDLNNLTKLEISNAGLTEIPATYKFPKLTEAKLNSNKITKFDVSGMPQLKTLSLTSNQLTSVTEDTAKFDNPELSELNLSSNQITEVNLKGLENPLKVNLSKNQISSLGDVAAPSVVDLNVEQNQLVDLAGIENLIALVTLSVKTNQISDITAITKASSTLESANITVQTVSHEPIEAASPQPLAGILAHPSDLEITWRSSTATAPRNMASVNAATGKFTAAQEGNWRIGFTASGDFGTYSGSVVGEAVGENTLTPEITGLMTVLEGDSITLTAAMNTDDPATYRWLKGTAAYNMAVIDDATDKTLTLDDVDLTNRDDMYQVEITTDAGVFMSDPQKLRVQPKFSDPGFTSCFIDQLGADWATPDLWNVDTYKCSHRQIKSLDDLHHIWPLIRANRLDFSNNEITDLSPVMKDGKFLDKGINLSNNAISDISPLGVPGFKFSWKDLNSYYPSGVILDGNRISDLSALANAGLPTKDGMFVLSISNQKVGAPGGQINEGVAVPKAVKVDETLAPLTYDGVQVSQDTISFSSSGIKTLKWDEPLTNGVKFDGDFMIPVGLETEISVSPESPKGGHTMTLSGVGFNPGEVVTFTWSDGSVIGSVPADGGGLVTYSAKAPYREGEDVITASGDKGTKTEISVTLVDDDVVAVPDAALRACIEEHLSFEPGTTLYTTKLEKFDGAFDCSNQGVTDLTGLAALRASSYDLSSNQVEKLATLGTLTPATAGGKITVDLSDNAISDVSGTVAQPNLSKLVLNENRILDFSGLNVLTETQITAFAQSIDTEVQLVGIKYPAPQAIDGAGNPVEMMYPEQATVENGELTWNEPGVFESLFIFEATDELDLEALGSVNTVVINPGEVALQVAPGKVYPGQLVNLLATGMRPGEEVTFTLHSDPVELGTATADSLGVASLTEVVIPEDTAPGAHSVTATGATSETTATTDLEVIELPDDVVVEVPGEDPEQPAEEPEQPAPNPKQPAPEPEDPAAQQPAEESPSGLPATGGASGLTALFGMALVAAFGSVISGRKLKGQN